MARPTTLAFLLAASSACMPADLDENVDGVFPCEASDDCPPESACIGGTCFRENPPRVEIVAPEDELVVGQPAGIATMSVPVSLRGEGLELTAARGDDDYGLGYIQISVDDVPVAKIDSGELASTITIDVDVAAEPGGHTVEAAAHFPDGARYDNPDAIARRFFWIDDGRPHVAIKAPFSQTRFDLDGQSIPVELATLNFSIAPPDPTFTQPGLGHVHFYYDVDMPACAFDEACDAAYLAVAAPEQGAVHSMSTLAPLPAAPEGNGRLVAVLRRLDHTLYVDDNGYPIWMDVALRRAAEDD